MTLTDVAIRTAKPREKSFKLSDAGGLHILVSSTGSKLWRLAYRFGGKQKQLALGSYPETSLSEARGKRDAAKRTLKTGSDPTVQTKLDRITASVSAAQTFGAIADELVAKLDREGRAAATLSKKRWLIDTARPDLGSRPIASITAADVLAVLQKIERQGLHETARRMRSTIGAVFRFAIATARAENDPSVALRGALTVPQVTHRAAVTVPKQFGTLLQAVWSYSGQPSTTAALKLMALLFPRPGELRTAEWAEFDLTAEQPVWTIPAAKTKMRRPHSIPLSKQATAILTELRELTGGGKLVFPGIGPRDIPISENTLNGALRRLGYTKEEATSHGFRATASTLLNESGLWSVDAVERALAHQDKDAIRRAYARGEHWEERIRLTQWWADRCEELREATRPSTPKSQTSGSRQSQTKHSRNSEPKRVRISASQ